MTAPRPMLRTLVRASAALIIGAASSVLVALPAGASGPAPAAVACGTWHKATVARGFQTLENLAFDGRGGMLLSETTLLGGGSVRRLTADGTRSVVVPKLDGPGGIVVDGAMAYFTTGNTILSGLLGRRDGTVRKVDLDSGAVSTIATGLVMPNGLAQLPGGDLLVSRDVGASTSMTRVRPDGSTSVFAPGARSTNGIAVDRDRGRLYVASTFEPTTAVNVVDLADPAAAPRRIVLPGLGPLNAADDLTLGGDGMVYVALNTAGQVVRVDPDTGASCVVARGMPLVSSVRFGAGPGWDAHSLYATTFTGQVLRLTP